MDLQKIKLLTFICCMLLFLFLEKTLPFLKFHPNKNRVVKNALLMLSGAVMTAILKSFVTLAFSFNILSKLDQWQQLIASVLILDFAIYWQHRFMHWIPWLWTLHRLHHSDTTFDVTTGVRFHPMEIVVSYLYKFFIISLLGISIEHFLIYEIILSSFALFNHSNISLYKYDHWVRKFVVTADFHRTHHSPNSKLMNSNFGNFLSVWDHIFKSYDATPTKVFGVSENKP